MADRPLEWHRVVVDVPHRQLKRTRGIVGAQFLPHFSLTGPRRAIGVVLGDNGIPGRRGSGEPAPDSR